MPEPLTTLRDNRAGAALARAWRGRFGSYLQALAGFVVLYLAIYVLLRHHRPPFGEIVFGAIVGLLYGLIAFGLILIYRANRIINFAQAEMGAAPAVLAVVLIKVQHVPYLVAFVIAMGSAVVAGLVVDFLVVRRFFNAPRLVLSVATIGVSLLFAAVQLYVPRWLGAKLVDPTAPTTPFSGLKFTLDPVVFNGNHLVIVGAVIAVVIGLTLFFKLTDVGIAVRAAAENADRASLLGVPVRRVSTVVWVLASLLSALGVFLRIPIIGLPIGVDVGPIVLVYGLAAAVIARMESFSVALAAGVAIGILEQSLYYFSRDPSVAAALMLPILLAFMLAQRRRASRGLDTGVSTWSMAKEFRPIPPELRRVPEVVWTRFGLGVAVLGVAIALPYLVGLGNQILAAQFVIYGIVAVSLVVLTGWAGQISLGQWGFAGVGALVAGGLTARLHADFFATLAAAGAAGAIVSVVIGLPALRIQGLYLAVTTLAFAIAVNVYALSPTYFGRFLPTHAQRVERPLLYGRFDITGPRAFYEITLLFLALAVLSARALRRSRAGRVMIASRDNERGAQAFGISIAGARLAAFAISGFWAALAGALFAFHQGVVESRSFDPTLSLTLLVIVVIGGLTSVPGALLGTLFFALLRSGSLSAQSEFVVVGVFVLVLLLVVPGGLAQVYYGTRDALLRVVAARRRIAVPSLVADARVEEAEAQAAAAALTRAAATVEQAAEVGAGVGG